MTFGRGGGGFFPWRYVCGKIILFVKGRKTTFPLTASSTKKEKNFTATLVSLFLFSTLNHWKLEQKEENPFNKQLGNLKTLDSLGSLRLFAKKKLKSPSHEIYKLQTRNHIWISANRGLFILCIFWSVKLFLTAG